MVAVERGDVWPDIVLEDQDFDVFGWIGSCDQRQPAQCMASSR